MRGAITRAAAHGDVVIVAIGALMLGAYLSATLLFPKASGRVVFGDATHHFIQLRSVIFDHDLDFLNEHVTIYELANTKEETDRILADLGTSTGLVRNYMPIGPAILWAPLYLLAIGLDWLRWLIGMGPVPDGFSRGAQMAPGVTGVIAATAGVMLSWRTARRLLDAESALAGTSAVWLGSHALYYSMVSPSYSHAASMLTSSLIVWFWLRHQREPTLGSITVLGALVGAAALMRWQDVVFFIVPFSQAIAWRAPWRTRLAAIATASLAALVVFSPQMVVWHVLYGQPFAIPQGPSFIQWASPHPIDVLFSTNHGLLTWTPLVALSLWGLGMFLPRNREAAPVILGLVLVAWYVNAAVADWWAGEAFGARRFLSLFPFLVLGMATWFQGREQRAGVAMPRVVVACVLIVANGLLLLQYQVFMKGFPEIAPYPSGGFDMWAARFLVPVRLVGRWFAGG
jgi:hypothetical protein